MHIRPNFGSGSLSGAGPESWQSSILGKPQSNFGESEQSRVGGKDRADVERGQKSRGYGR